MIVKNYLSIPEDQFYCGIMNQLIFNIATPIGLRDSDEIRRSRKDPDVLLFYGGAKPRWLCAVAKDQDAGAGFLITTYPTDSIKVGELLWKKSK